MVLLFSLLVMLEPKITIQFQEKKLSSGFFVGQVSEERADKKKEKWLVYVRPVYGINLIEVQRETEPYNQKTKY
jgi:hypothetical protein